jgi:hypothetical protein
MPRDVVNGLGAASRDLLAACLALFDDSTLQSRMSALWDRWLANDEVDDSTEIDEAVTSVQNSVEKWKSSEFSDDALRVLLWMYLREAFRMPAATFASLRSATIAADDLVAHVLHSLEPGSLDQDIDEKLEEQPVTLDALARNTLSELTTSVLEGDDEYSVQARESLLSDMRERLEQLAPEDQTRLLDAVGADELNDAALKRILMTGGGLTAFGVGVSMAGFSAYILAAQVSAFIPLVSGPALVSFVAVLSNPITITAATAGAAWWLWRSTNGKIRAEVGIRVLSLLVLQAPNRGDAGIRQMIEAFDALPELYDEVDYDPDVMTRYLDNWESIATVRRKASRLDDKVASIMERGFEEVEDADALKRRNNDSELQFAAMLGGLTLGEAAYHAYSLDPMVMEAADFSRIADLNSPLAFSQFAQEIQAMEPLSHLGAISNLKGYVAERLVASELIEKGHVVEFPEASNQPGWDISIDGAHFQIKDRADLSGLASHFEKGYDYPVIVNAELAEPLAELAGEDAPEWIDQVHFIEGYSNQIVETITIGSIDAADSLMNLHVPEFALILSAARGIRSYNRSEITSGQAIHEVLLDGGTRAGLAVAGGYVGSGMGLLLFGPAGALVFGGVVPILSQMQSKRARALLGEWIQDETYGQWSDETQEEFEQFLTELEPALIAKAELVKNRMIPTGSDVVSQYVRWRVGEELSYLRELYCRLRDIREHEALSLEEKCADLMAWLTKSTLHPVVYQQPLTGLADAFSKRPTTTQRTTAAAEKYYRKGAELTKGFLSFFTSDEENDKKKLKE